MLLMMAGGRGSLEQLSIRRVAIQGAIGAVVLPLSLMVAVMIQEPGASEEWVFAVVTLGLACLLGAGCASATLALARRTPH
jgi:hypothetical protein